MIQGSDNEFVKIFKRKKMIRITRFRLGSEMKEGRYWEGEEKRMSKLCGWVEESWKHVMEVCMGESKGEGRDEGNIEDTGG